MHTKLAKPTAPARCPATIAAPARRTGLALLSQAGAVLAEAAGEPSAAERFRLAHLAALRSAAALFAERAKPAQGRRRPTSAWVLLGSVAPELADWAAYFSAGAEQRAAVEAGATRAVTVREADDLLRASAQFHRLVEMSMGRLATPLAS